MKKYSKLKIVIIIIALWLLSYLIFQSISSSIFTTNGLKSSQSNLPDLHSIKPNSLDLKNKNWSESTTQLFFSPTLVTVVQTDFDKTDTITSRWIWIHLKSWFVLTNKHVIDSLQSAWSVTMWWFSYSIINTWFHESKDLAVIKVDQPKNSTHLDDSNQVNVLVRDKTAPVSVMILSKTNSPNQDLSDYQKIKLIPTSENIFSTTLAFTPWLSGSPVMTDQWTLIWVVSWVDKTNAYSISVELLDLQTIDRIDSIL